MWTHEKERKNKKKVLNEIHLDFHIIETTFHVRLVTKLVH